MPKLEGDGYTAEFDACVRQYDRPTLKKLGTLYGEPPWTLEVPVPGALPDAALEHIGAIEMGGMRFVREDGR